MHDLALAVGYLAVISLVMGIHFLYGRGFFGRDTRLDIQSRNVDEFFVGYYSDLHRRMLERFTGEGVRVLKFSGAGDTEFSRHILLSREPVQLAGVESFPDLSISVEAPITLNGVARLPYVYCRSFAITEAGESAIERLVVNGKARIAGAVWESDLLLVRTSLIAQVDQFRASRFGAASYAIVPSHLPEPMLTPLPAAGREGTLVIPAGAIIREPVIARGNVIVGDGAVIDTSAKVHGDVQLGQQVEVTGSLIVGKSLRMGDGCRLLGDVLVHGELIASGAAQFGLGPKRAVSVVCRSGQFAGPLRGHGFLVAELGHGIEVGHAAGH